MKPTSLRNALFVALMVPACSAMGPKNNAGEVRDCGSEERVLLDCSSEVSYQGTSGEAALSVMNIASAEGKFEEKAIRRVNEQVEQFVAIQTRACRDYNACVLSRDQYRAEAADTRRRMQVLPALQQALKAAKTEEERQRALDQLYRGIVPDDRRVEEVTFQLGMIAEIPAALGGGIYSVAPGGAIPTGAKVRFEVNVSRQAYVYIFQTTPSGEVNVLFPDPRIGTQNPVAGGSNARIPARKSFRVNSKDLGVENVYIVASAEPVADLDAALNKVKSGQVNTVTQDPLLKSVAMVAPAKDAQKCKSRALTLDADDGGGATGCTRPRALELDDEESSSGGASGSSLSVPAGMQVRTPPGDNLIVTVFSFQHLSEQQYRAGGGAKTSGTQLRNTTLDD